MMKNQKEGFGYNERLFSRGFRGWIHTARFRWVRQKLSQNELSTNHVLELGCFDGKVLEYIEDSPALYMGFDANWENGLDIAKQKYRDKQNYIFRMAQTQDDMDLGADDVFDLAISMETLEHIDDEKTVCDYLEKISCHLDGYFLITVPTEKGIVFTLKYLLNKIVSRDAERYTFKEFINASLGRTKRVMRLQHNGFDYENLVGVVGRYFDIVEISGHPFSFLPVPLCFGVGIVARSKKQNPCS